MLDVKLLRENLDEVKVRMATRGAQIDWEDAPSTASPRGRSGQNRAGSEGTRTAVGRIGILKRAAPVPR